MVPQPWHYRHFGPDNSVLGKAISLVLYDISSIFIHQLPVIPLSFTLPLPSVTYKKLSPDIAEYFPGRRGGKTVPD